LKKALSAACFNVSAGPFPYTAHVDPNEPGTTYIIPSKQLAVRGAIMGSVEETIVDLAKISVDSKNVIPLGGRGPGIFAGGEGPVPQDVTVYLF